MKLTHRKLKFLVSYEIIECYSKIQKSGCVSLKMKPLKTNHRILTWFCACTVKPPSKWKSLFFANLTAAIFLLNISSAGAAAVYFLRFVSDDLESCLFCLLQIAATVSLSYMIIVVFLASHRINNIFLQLERICNACKNSKLTNSFTDSITMVFHLEQVKTNNLSIFWKKQTRKVNGCGVFTSNILWVDSL